MNFQHILYIYYFFTLSITSFYFYGLYKIENSIYLFSLNLSNSTFYLCLLYHLIFMLFVLFLNCFVYILSGEIASYLDLLYTANLESDFLSYRFSPPKGHIKSMIEAIPKFYFPQFVSHYMTLITNMTYRKGEYFYSFISGNNYDKRNVFRYFLLYILVFYINYILYVKTNINIPNAILRNNSFYEYLFFYELNYDFFRNIITILEGLIRLMINIYFNDIQYLEYKRNVIDIITFIKYVLNLSYLIKIIIFSFINHEYFIYSTTYGIKIVFDLIQFFKKIYSNYSFLKNIRSLADYDINVELELNGEINKNMNKEEINKIKKEKIHECTICLDDMETGKYLNCGHVFHFNCIKEWIVQCKKCPNCKLPVDLKSNKKTDFFIKALGTKNKKTSNDINNVTNNDINSKEQKQMSNEELIQNNELEQKSSNQTNKEKENFKDYPHFNDINYSNSGTNIDDSKTEIQSNNNNEKKVKKMKND